MKVIINGKTVIEKGQTLVVPATTRLAVGFITEEERNMIIDDSPVQVTWRQDQSVKSGEYVDDHTIRWFGSTVNTGSDPISADFDLTPDSSQTVTSVKVNYYRLNPDGNGYILDHT